MSGIAPPNGCIKIVVSSVKPPQSMEVTVGPTWISTPVGNFDRVDGEPPLGVHYVDAVSGATWFFFGGPGSGTWHSVNPSRYGTWGPC